VNDMDVYETSLMILNTVILALAHSFSSANRFSPLRRILPEMEAFLCLEYNAPYKYEVTNRVVC